MKKYKEWLTNEIEIMESETSENYPHEQMVEREVVLNLIDQLDEPEVRQIKELDSYNDELIRDNNQLRNALDSQKFLSQKWIDKNKKYGGVYDIEYYIPVDKLYGKIVPKQEELEVKIQELIEAYKQEEDAYGELENGWISGFIKDLKNLVEDEQKYYVLDSEDIPLLEKVNNHTCKTTTGLSIYEDGRDNSSFELTEQEIKDYDERFWAFAVPVEETELF